MKLILKQEVPNLGTLGDVVDVKPGYARNYLLPRGLALPVTGQQSKEFRHHMQYLEKMRKGEIAQAQQKAALMKVLDLEVTRKAGPGGRLFGSVNNRDIQEVLEAAGYTLER
ncbi:MAG: 50S ribosomal protein L9, partial [SAR324 cluster bacterium]|nr:50S ribosomal protein L9 [SAR324 cluster bacterium]